MFNLFNEENPAAFINTYPANATASTPPNGKRPTTYSGDPLQGEQRLGQLGVRIRF